VTLLLPPVAMPGTKQQQGPLSVSKKLSRDFATYTLHPRWDGDCVFHLSLPTPRTLLPTQELLFAADASPNKNKPLDVKACAALMDWWGGGVLRVEVVDGERFNSDINLGLVDILLSQFLLRDVIGGTTPLSKQSSTDKVSGGTITYHAFLHLPEASALLLPDPPLPSSSLRPPVAAALDEPEEREVVEAGAPLTMRIARSVRLSQAQPRGIKTPSPSGPSMRAVSPVQTNSPYPSAPAPAAAPSGAAHCSPPPPPQLLSSRPPSMQDATRQAAIERCLNGLESLQASSDALLLSVTKMRGGRGGAGAGASTGRAATPPPPAAFVFL